MRSNTVIFQYFNGCETVCIKYGSIPGRPADIVWEILWNIYYVCSHCEWWDTDVQCVSFSDKLPVTWSYPIAHQFELMYGELFGLFKQLKKIKKKARKKAGLKLFRTLKSAAFRVANGNCSSEYIYYLMARLLARWRYLCDKRRKWNCCLADYALIAWYWTLLMNRTLKIHHFAIEGPWILESLNQLGMS